MTTINNNILTTSQYQQNNLMAPADNDMLGRDAFLRLLTTQLQNQDPLSPMENEAFVAQLAQFSSVEGIKGMQASLETMVGSMRSDQLLAGANLVGRNVGLGSQGVQAAGGISTQIDIELSEAADNVSLSVIDDATGKVVYQGDLGPQTAGTISTTWSGVNSQGQSLLRGSYTFLAVAENGARRVEQTSQAVAQVQSVVWNPSTQTMNLELSGGARITMADIERISG